MKNGNLDLTLRKRLFYVAEPTLLQRKTAAFGMQNNRFCKMLITRWLHDSRACNKSLHIFRLFPAYTIRNIAVF